MGAPEPVLLLKGCAKTGTICRIVMANAISAAARPAVAPWNLMAALSAEIAANSSLVWFTAHL